MLNAVLLAQIDEQLVEEYKIEHMEDEERQRPMYVNVWRCKCDLARRLLAVGTAIGRPVSTTTYRIRSQRETLPSKPERRTRAKPPMGSTTTRRSRARTDRADRMHALQRRMA